MREREREKSKEGKCFDCGRRHGQMWMGDGMPKNPFWERVMGFGLVSRGPTISFISVYIYIYKY